MYKVKVYVTLRESVLDPQGKAVTQFLTFFKLSRSMPMFASVNIWN